MFSPSKLLGHGLGCGLFLDDIHDGVGSFMSIETKLDNELALTLKTSHTPHLFAFVYIFLFILAFLGIGTSTMALRDTSIL